EKWLRVNQLLREKRIGILALQETHLNAENAKSLNEIFHSSLQVYASEDPNAPLAARGVAFVVNKRVFNADDQVTHRVIAAGRAAEITVKWGANETLTLVNVYAPNDPNDNAEFWTMLKSDLTSRSGRRTDMMLGDMNIVEAAEDRAPARADPARANSSLTELKTSLNLTDGWRNMNPNKRGFTFIQSCTGSQSRLDRIYVSNRLLMKSAHWIIEEPGINSDHSLVSASLANYATPYIGPGRWVIPRAVIADKQFMDETVEAGRKAADEMSQTDQNGGTGARQAIYTAFKTEIARRARKRTKELFAKWDRKIEDLKKKIDSTM
ncbi:Endonuclease/exonuclease/phosphatase, partial [Lenzites betulinus]